MSSALFANLFGLLVVSVNNNFSSHLFIQAAGRILLRRKWAHHDRLYAQCAKTRMAASSSKS